MSKYDDIGDANFYKFINKKYAKYKIPKTKKTLRQICFPEKYEFQLPQLFLSEFINPKTPYKGILVYHRIGAGKTCAAIQIAEKSKTSKKIVIVLPASLKGNFRSELRSQCAGNDYLTVQERKKLTSLSPSSKEYSEIIAASDKRIDKYYTIYSYNKFIDLLKRNTISLDNVLLIIDEIHNLISETGTYYETLYNTIHASIAPIDMRLVIMTATPIFDKPIEISLTMNLLLPLDRQLPTGQDFVNEFIDVIRDSNKSIKYRVKNMDVFKQYVKGYVSYYRGAPPYTFPRSEIHYSRTRMSTPQVTSYKSVQRDESKEDRVIDFVNHDISNSFFIGTRMISNINFPNNDIGQRGFDSWTPEDMKITSMLEISPKFVKILRSIKKCKGTVFVYSNFKEYGGIKSFATFLEARGYKNYEKSGEGKRRFAIWSGDQEIGTKDEIRAVFNHKNNVDGSRIKIILGSPSIKEGVTLLRVQEVHILESYWNFSRIAQVIGRAIRYCSHKDVPYEDQFVKIVMYLAVHPSIKMSVDERILKMAMMKERINGQFELALKEAAIDCDLFKNANVYPGEQDITCMT